MIFQKKVGKTWTGCEIVPFLFKHRNESCRARHYMLRVTDDFVKNESKGLKHLKLTIIFIPHVPENNVLYSRYMQ